MGSCEVPPLVISIGAGDARRDGTSRTGFWRKEHEAFPWSKQFKARLSVGKIVHNRIPRALLCRLEGRRLQPTLGHRDQFADGCVEIEY